MKKNPETPEKDESETSQQDTPAQEESPKSRKRFRTVLREEEIEIEDKNGVPIVYIVREMMGDEKERWNNTMADRVRIVDGKPCGLKEFKDLHPGLICRCLFVQSTGKQVDIQTVRKWPTSQLEELYGLCLEICGLTEPAVEEVKKA